MEDVLLTYFVAWATMMTFSPIAGEIISRVGLRRTMSLRAPLYSILSGMLLTYGEFKWSPGMIGLAYGLPLSLYWTSLNIDFTENVHIERAGVESSLIHALPSLMGIVGPIIGGYVISALGFGAILWASIVVSFIAVVPLLMTTDKKVRRITVPGKEEMDLDGLYLQRFFLQGLTQFGTILIWPVYVWQLFDSTVSLGVVAMLAALAQSVFTIMVGKVGDRHGNSSIIKVGALLSGAVFLVMPHARTEMHAFAIATISGFATSMVSTSIYADFSKHINSLEKTSHNVLREMTINLGRMMFAVFAMRFFDYTTIFQICAAASLVIFLI